METPSDPETVPGPRTAYAAAPFRVLFRSASGQEWMAPFRFRATRPEQESITAYFQRFLRPPETDSRPRFSTLLGGVVQMPLPRGRLLVLQPRLELLALCILLVLVGYAFNHARKAGAFITFNCDHLRAGENRCVYTRWQPWMVDRRAFYFDQTETWSSGQTMAFKTMPWDRRLRPVMGDPKSVAALAETVQRFSNHPEYPHIRYAYNGFNDFNYTGITIALAALAVLLGFGEVSWMVYDRVSRRLFARCLRLSGRWRWTAQLDDDSSLALAGSPHPVGSPPPPFPYGWFLLRWVAAGLLGTLVFYVYLANIFALHTYFDRLVLLIGALLVFGLAAWAAQRWLAGRYITLPAWWVFLYALLFLANWLSMIAFGRGPSIFGIIALVVILPLHAWLIRRQFGRIGWVVVTDVLLWLPYAGFLGFMWFLQEIGSNWFFPQFLPEFALYSLAFSLFTGLPLMLAAALSARKEKRETTARALES